MFIMTNLSFLAHTAFPAAAFQPGLGDNKRADRYPWAGIAFGACNKLPLSR